MKAFKYVFSLIGFFGLFLFKSPILVLISGLVLIVSIHDFKANKTRKIDKTDL